MKKALIIASVPGFIYSFEQSNIEILKSLGYEIHICSNFTFMKQFQNEFFKNVDKKIHLNFVRSPFSIKNILLIQKLKKIFKNEHYDIIHCHTPVASLLARISASKTRKKGSTLVYTAHGFHFFKGSSFRNWLFFYPLEKFCAKRTDVLITINNEDYIFASNKFNCKVRYIHGVGIDRNKFLKTTCNKNLKNTLDLSNKFVLLSIGELIERKNHITAIKALKEMKDKDIIYLIAGEGKLEKKLSKFIEEMSLQDRVTLLGYRLDIVDLLNLADVFIFPSLQEGLPVSLMEAMSTETPCICSNIRGNSDLIENNVNGFLFEKQDYQDLSAKIQIVKNNEELKQKFISASTKKIELFENNKVRLEMLQIYNEINI